MFTDTAYIYFNRSMFTDTHAYFFIKKFVTSSCELRRVRICARRHEIDVVVVASAKAQMCAHLRTLGRALATQ